MCLQPFQRFVMEIFTETVHEIQLLNTHLVTVGLIKNRMTFRKINERGSKHEKW